MCPNCKQQIINPIAHEFCEYAEPLIKTHMLSKSKLPLPIKSRKSFPKEQKPITNHAASPLEKPRHFDILPSDPPNMLDSSYNANARRMLEDGII